MTRLRNADEWALALLRHKPRPRPAAQEPTVLCATCRKPRRLGRMATAVTCQRCIDRLAAENERPA